MSHLVASTAPIAGAHTVKRFAGFGILGAAIPAAGDSGASPVFNDSPISTSEYYWRVETPPASGVLEIFADLSFLHSGAADGSWPWVARIFQDRIDQGTETITDNFGAVSATAPGATLTGTSSLSAGAATGTVSAAAPGATLTGTASITPGAASGTGNASAPGATLTGSASISPGAASGDSAGTAPGAVLTGTSSLVAGSASAANPDAAAPGANLTGTSTLLAGGAHSSTAVFVAPANARLVRVIPENRRARVR